MLEVGSETASLLNDGESLQDQTITEENNLPHDKHESEKYEADFAESSATLTDNEEPSLQEQEVGEKYKQSPFRPQTGSLRLTQ